MGKRGLTAKKCNCSGGLGMVQSGFKHNALNETNGAINYLENTRVKDSGFLAFFFLKAEKIRDRTRQHDQRANKILVRGGQGKRQLYL